LLAAEFKLAVKVAAGPPGVRLPPLGQALSQREVLIKAQLTGLFPELVKEKICEAIVNGPPANPTELKPAAGVIKISGIAKRLMRFCPAGVPHPVQRS
jgi:hypothetical protein